MDNRTTRLFNPRDGVPDLVLMSEMSENAILQTLQQRYQKDLIYTSIGEVLLSINPFKMIKNLYSEQTMAAYVHRSPIENPPHVFTIAESAYRSMSSENENQCILITGESGAGKTEASKQVLQYIASICGSDPAIQATKNSLLQSNPVLESFGNAKTLRNNNSLVSCCS